MKTLNQFLDESTGGGVPLTPQELEIQKKMSRLNVRLARKRSQQMQKAKVDDTETAPEQVKEGNKVLFPLGDVHSGESKKKILVWKKKEKGSSEQVKEAKVEAGRSDYGKASVRNKRKFGKEGEPAVFDASGERGMMIDQRRAEHKAKRGVKEEADAYKYVVSKLKKKYGSGVLTKGDKIKPQSAADKAKARAHQAKVDAENAAERKKDPSQGRYPKGYSNRGSD